MESFIVCSHFSSSTRSSDSVCDPVEFESVDGPWSVKSESNQGWPMSIDMPKKGGLIMFAGYETKICNH